jgi:Tfp pilus assembly protein PilF
MEAIMAVRSQWRVAIVLSLFMAGLATPAFADRRSEAAQVSSAGMWRYMGSGRSRQPLAEGRRTRPHLPAAWNNLGIAYEQQGQFNKARTA